MNYSSVATLCIPSSVTLPHALGLRWQRDARMINSSQPEGCIAVGGHSLRVFLPWSQR